MKNTKNIFMLLTLAFCFALVNSAMAGDLDKEPIWQITKGQNAKEVYWKTYKPNKRFAIYNAGTSADIEDDLVLDRETGLVWERSPGGFVFWFGATGYCFHMEKGGRFGFRLPTIEELASLLDSTQGPPALPEGHPFINVVNGYYLSVTTNTTDDELGEHVWGVDFNLGDVASTRKTYRQNVWCVRGGQGHDAPGFDHD